MYIHIFIFIYYKFITYCTHLRIVFISDLTSCVSREASFRSRPTTFASPSFSVQAR